MTKIDFIHKMTIAATMHDKHMIDYSHHTKLGIIEDIYNRIEDMCKDEEKDHPPIPHVHCLDCGNLHLPIPTCRLGYATLEECPDLRKYKK